MMLAGLHASLAASPAARSDVTACIDCGGAPCLESACRSGHCERDKMVADGQALGLSVNVPAICERRRLYLCENLPERRLLRCLPTANAPAPAANASSAAAAPVPGSGRAAAPGPSSSAAAAPGPSSRPALPGAAVSLAAASKPQLYPPEWMQGDRAPKYFTMAKKEQELGITYDEMTPPLNGMGSADWNEGANAMYFVPDIEYARNTNYEGALPENYGKPGWGLSMGQWCIILTLLFLNGDTAVTRKMMLPLMVIAMAPALMPAVDPNQREWSKDLNDWKRRYPAPLTRTDNNEIDNTLQGAWQKKGNWP